LKVIKNSEAHLKIRPDICYPWVERPFTLVYYNVKYSGKSQIND